MRRHPIITPFEHKTMNRVEFNKWNPPSGLDFINCEPVMDERGNETYIFTKRDGSIVFASNYNPLLVNDWLWDNPGKRGECNPRELSQLKKLDIIATYYPEGDKKEAIRALWKRKNIVAQEEYPEESSRRKQRRIIEEEEYPESYSSLALGESKEEKKEELKYGIEKKRKMKKRNIHKKVKKKLKKNKNIK